MQHQRWLSWSFLNKIFSYEWRRDGTWKGIIQDSPVDAEDVQDQGQSYVVVGVGLKGQAVYHPILTLITDPDHFHLSLSRPLLDGPLQGDFLVWLMKHALCTQEILLISPVI